MTEHVRTLTRRGNMNVPSEVRRLLAVETGDQIAFVVADGEVRLVAARARLDAAFGSVKPLAGELADEFDAQIHLAKEERAERTMMKMVRGE
ncbi:MAG: AbrB/MazE/SpoVT family DNA-binding domain-containing protein [Chloroflexia bacterium]|nr:AbrB/MazE/SpoVT family DNA-binding domain-containing protein [Chloroflexia bacterium]